VAHRLFLALLHSPLGRRLDGFCELRFIGHVSGRPVALPVQCARKDARLVIYVGHAADKQWWRNFRQGHSVHVRVSGETYAAHGRVVDARDPERAWAERTYRRRFPKVDVARTDPMLIIDADPRKAL
jgi:hypothetical protein